MESTISVDNCRGVVIRFGGEVPVVSPGEVVSELEALPDQPWVQGATMLQAGKEHLPPTQQPQITTHTHTLAPHEPIYYCNYTQLLYVRN